ncbi:MAG: hypothetical protein WA721_16670 [Candidatus Binataceae bacterium]
MATDDLDISINDYIARFLLRYFRDAVTLQVQRPAIEHRDDIDLLRLHWASSKPVIDFIDYLTEHPHELQAVLEVHRRADDAVVRGRIDARATIIARMLTGHPTLSISQEPVRSLDSGPNHVLTWVIEQAWRLVFRFQHLLPADATYRRRVESSASKLERLRRYEPIRRALKESDLYRRPVSTAVKEASRSRRRIYVAAAKAYRFLCLIEAGESDALSKLLNDTVLGPLPIWQRFELAVAIGTVGALAHATGDRVALSFLAAGSQEPIARAGRFALYWQTRTAAYTPPVPEPSEAILLGLLEHYGLGSAGDRPDLLVVDTIESSVLAVIEAKFFVDDNSADAMRAALSQIVRYARGYREQAFVPELLDNSFVALARRGAIAASATRPDGVPWMFDLEAMIKGGLEVWASRVVAEQTPTQQSA